MNVKKLFGLIEAFRFSANNLLCTCLNRVAPKAAFVLFALPKRTKNASLYKLLRRTVYRLAAHTVLQIE